MSPTSSAPRTFTLESQLAFAELSGDYNPMHVDPVAARRLLFGAPVVHGIHLLMWALEGHAGLAPLKSLRATFQKPVRVGDEAQWTSAPRGNGTRIQVRVGPVLCASFDLECSAGQVDAPGWADHAPPRTEPMDTSAAELQHARGTLELRTDTGRLRALFPRVAQRLPLAQAAALLATTRLVGMHRPGLRSVYSELACKATGDCGDGGLHYAVASFDARFSLASIDWSAAGLAGTIGAFLRPAPVCPLDQATAAGLVRAGEFAGQRALVVGGSRGLGEVAVRLLAAGGADVAFSYRQGTADARRLQQQSGARCFELDVFDTPANIAQALPGDRTHLYYFATPFIFAGSKGVYSEDLYRRFHGCYVDGLRKVAEPLVATGLERIYSPSTVAIDEPPPDMAEYVAAKTRAEALCADLERRHPGLRCERPRLPRLATDQTVSLVPVENADPVPLMLQHLRAFHGEAAIISARQET